MLVVNVLGDRRMIAAHWAVLVSAELEGTEVHLKRVVLQQTPDERFATLEDDLHGLGGLEGADGSRKDTENARLRARRRELRGRRLGG